MQNAFILNHALRSKQGAVQHQQPLFFCLLFSANICINGIQYITTLYYNILVVFYPVNDAKMACRSECSARHQISGAYAGRVSFGTATHTAFIAMKASRLLSSSLSSHCLMRRQLCPM